MAIKQLYPTSRASLGLNFEGSNRLDPRITFTRATAGTYVDSSGLIKSAATGEARFDHDPVTLQSLGLLIEESRTNYIQNSTDFNAGDWSFASAGTSPGIPVCTTNFAAAPDGTNTATRLVCDHGGGATSGDQSYLRCNRDSSTRAVESIWIKSNTSSNQTIYMTAQIQPVIATNTWKRWYALSNDFRIGARGDRSDQNIDILIWGAQVEDGSQTDGFHTSYIPTAGSATATRAADVATVSNANNVAYPSTNTLVQRPFGASAIGLSSLSITASNTVKRISVYPGTLSQLQINTAAEKTDEFWRWRILGSSFALPTFTTDGQVTVDWGDGTVETLTTSEHTFTNGGGYHDVGFRLDSGTNFSPRLNNNATHKDKVIAVGPGPESMKVDLADMLEGASNLASIDSTISLTSASNGKLRESICTDCTSLKSFPYIDFSGASLSSIRFAWKNCTSMESFPLLDLSQANNLGDATSRGTWYNCSSLKSFPAIHFPNVNNASGAWLGCSSMTKFNATGFGLCTSFYATWDNCSSMTNFPLIDTSSATNFTSAWRGCSNLSSFPLIDTSSGTNFSTAWQNCSSLTSFPLISTGLGTNFDSAWSNCNSISSAFPLIDTSNATTLKRTWKLCSGISGTFPQIETGSVTNFQEAWSSCSSISGAFPLIDTSSGTNFYLTWNDCSSISGAFPLIDTSLGTNFHSCWANCSSLTSFPSINASSGTSFTGAWSNCSSLTSFSSINASSGTSFTNAWRNCSALTNFPANFFDSWSATPANSCFYQTWDGCSSLPPASVVNILDSIAVSGVSAPSGTGTNHKKITIDWDGTGTPATTSAAAITTLKSRNWAIYLNNVLQ